MMFQETIRKIYVFLRAEPDHQLSELGDNDLIDMEAIEAMLAEEEADKIDDHDLAEDVSRDW